MVKAFIAMGLIGTVSALALAYYWRYELPAGPIPMMKNIGCFFYLWLIPFIWGSLGWAIRDWRRCLRSSS